MESPPSAAAALVVAAASGTDATTAGPPPNAHPVPSDLAIFQPHFSFALPQPFLYTTTTAMSPTHAMDPNAMTMAVWPAPHHAHLIPMASPSGAGAGAMPTSSPVDLLFQATPHLSPSQLQGHALAPAPAVPGNVLGPTAAPATTTLSPAPTESSSSPPNLCTASADRAVSLDPPPTPCTATTKRKPLIPMPELPSALEKRCKGGPGKKRKGISDEERAARQQDRVARNRIAAQESRNKKRAYVETLEATAADLQEANAQLADDNERLRKRVRVLEEDKDQLAKKLDWVMAQMARVTGVQVPQEFAAEPSPPTSPLDPAAGLQQPLAQPAVTLPAPAPAVAGPEPVPEVSDFITMSLSDLTALIADTTSSSPASTLPSMLDFAAMLSGPAPAVPASPSSLAMSSPVPSSPSSASSPSSSSSLSLPSASSTSTPGFPGPAAAGKLSASAGNSQQRRPLGARVGEAPRARTIWTTTPATWATKGHSLPAWDSAWTLGLVALMHWTLAVATTWMRICTLAAPQGLCLYEALVAAVVARAHVSVDVAQALVAGVLHWDARALGVKTLVIQVPRALVDKLVAGRRRVEGDRALAKRWGALRRRPP